MLFVGPRRDRRLRHGDQRHQPDRHPRARRAVRHRHRRHADGRDRARGWRRREPMDTARRGPADPRGPPGDGACSSPRCSTALLILGVRFTAPPATTGRCRRSRCCWCPTARPRPTNPDASYIAQRNQHGAGTDPRAAAHVAARGLGPACSSTRARPGRASSRRGQAERRSARATARDRAQPRSRQRGRRATELEPPQSAAVPIETRPLPQVGVNASAADETLRLRGDSRRRPAARRHARVGDRGATWTAGSAASSRWARSTSRTRRGAARCPATRCSRSRSAPTAASSQVLVRRSSGHRELDQAARRHRAARRAVRPVPARDARALPGAALRLRMAVPRTAGSATARSGLGARP